MSPVSGDVSSLCVSCVSLSFHSINVPSEWGQKWEESWEEFKVSIQLMSPVSGDIVSKVGVQVTTGLDVSIQLMSPVSGD
jgi:hypothetical protein